MTSTRIEEIRQRAEAATPGEWTEERPTVADLEQLLREDDTPVRITPDGRVVPAAPASPEKDEPVAWATRNSAGQWISTTVALVASEWEKSAEPVYPLFTAPPSLADAVAALTKARDQFRLYERLHMAKGSIDGDAKARTNCEFADMLDAALAKIEGGRS